MSPVCQKAIVGIGTKRIAIAQERALTPRVRRYLVDVSSRELMDSAIADVSQLQAGFVCNAMLHAHVPLPRVRRFIRRIGSPVWRSVCGCEVSRSERSPIQCSRVA